jgi:hypothetical protein
MMYGREKSNFARVAVKLANKAEQSAAELVEPRAETKGNAGWQSTHQTRAGLACVCGKAARTDLSGGRGNSRPYRRDICCGARVRGTKRECRHVSLSAAHG